MESERAELVTSPIFILSDARTGSTLLRYILDTHQAICSPGELYLGELSRNLHWAVNYTTGQALPPSEQQAREKIVLAEVRRIISDLMSPYTKAKGKRIWCEKSPPNLDHLDLLVSIFPDAKYICLYRNCMDVVHSLIETNRLGWWSELAPYVVRSPENIVLAMVTRWVEKARKLLIFEMRNPSRCFRVKYEDLVSDPVVCLNPLFEFLNLEWDASLLKNVFSAPHDFGAGDMKANTSKKFYKSSVGKGSTIGLQNIPPNLLAEMNDILSRLGYSIVGPEWDYAPSPYIKPDPARAAGEAPPRLKQEYMNYFLKILEERKSSLRQLDSKLKVIVTGDEGGAWIMDMTERGGGRILPPDGKADCTAVISDHDLSDVVSGRLNVGEAYFQGRFRINGDMVLVRKIAQVLFGA